MEANSVGGVLSQVQGGRKSVIAHGAKWLTPAQRNYSAFKGELVGVIIFLKFWQYYLQGRPFILRVDNKALCWLHSLENPVGMTSRNIEYVHVRCRA